MKLSDIDLDRITEDTRVSDIFREYPDLADTLVGISSKFSVIKSPFGQKLMEKFTVGDLCKKVDMSFDEGMAKIRELIARYG